MKSLRKRLLVAAIVILLPISAFAQFFGSIVFDPSSYATLGHIWAQDIGTTAKIIQEIAQLVKIYDNAVQTYNQIYYNAKYFDPGKKSSWLGIASLVQQSHVLSHFGETATWDEAINLGINVPGAYGNATYGMTPAPFYSNYPTGQSLMSANIASVNVADGAAFAAMTTIAQSRANQPANDQALADLEATTQDGSLDTNSEVDQLNLANGGLVLLNRQLQNLSAIQTTAAEQQILANKVTLDNLADAVNFFSLQDQTVVAQPVAWGNSAQTIMNW